MTKLQEMIEKSIERSISKLISWEDDSWGNHHSNDSFVWQYVIVRWYNAWVWAGRLIQDTLGAIILEDARMLRYWRAKEWTGLSWVASHWLADKKEVHLNETQKKVMITDMNVSTFFICEPEVEKQIREYPTGAQS